jgi:aminoglycoside phosphotransferase (APT) family kinase protein
MGDWDGVVRDVLARNLPGLPVEAVEALGAGRDNAAYGVNGTLVLRFSTAPDPSLRATLVVSEGNLLDIVAEVSPVPIPVPRFVDADAGCLAYEKLRGTSLLELPPHDLRLHADDIAATLGEFLSALHDLPADRMSRLVEEDQPPPHEWLEEATTYHERLADQVPTVNREAVRRFLATEPPAADWAPVFSHNDLGIEHVLIDPATWRVTGVLDWTDAAIVDPAFDFGMVHRDLGPTALATALRHYRHTADLAGIAERARFYARCTVFEDLEHGIVANRPAYVAKCRASMSWLFPG